MNTETVSSKNMALESLQNNISRAQAMVRELWHGEQRWIARRADSNHHHHVVGQKPDGQLGLFFTNHPHIFKSQMEVERLVCSEPIEAVDALAWYRDFLSDCRETEKLFSK